MERRHSNRYGGNNGGEAAANVPAQQRPSQSSSLSPVVDINNLASAFLRQHSIYKEIEHATYNRGEFSKDFVPDSALGGIWRDSLQGFLAALCCTPSYVDLPYIRSYLLKIISILVVVRWQEWHRFAGLFLEPMRDPQRSRLDTSIPFPLHELLDESFLGEWGNAFYHQQYAFKPIMIEEETAKDYPGWRRVPLIQSQSETIGHGSYGSVTSEAIAPHQFVPKNSNSPIDSVKLVARKRMTAPREFKKERDNLVSLNSSLSRHDHIVRYLAIIIVGDDASPKDFSILLPLANMNLQTFLYRDDASLPKFSLKDLLQQAANVADAIKWLHDGLRIEDQVFVCCHMDLKLDNILVFLDEGTPIGKWKISDFGISSLKEANDVGTVRRSRSERLSVESPAQSLARLTNTARMPANRPPAIYTAPEVFKGNKVGRSSDVWSFGCILFQILARGVGPGVQKLNELDNLRSLEIDKTARHSTDYFFRESGFEKILNPHVKDWLAEGFPGGSWNDTYFVKSCKKLISEMLKVQPTDRWKAPQVNDRLWAILKGPGAAHYSEVESPSQTSRGLSLSVPGISVTPVIQERDESQIIPQATSSPNAETSARLNGPFDTWHPVPVTFASPPDSCDPAYTSAATKHDSSRFDPLNPEFGAPSRPHIRRESPNVRAQGSAPTRNAQLESPNPNSPHLERGSPESRSRASPSTRSRTTNQNYFNSQSQPNNNARPQASNSGDRGSTSQSSNRSNSLASSIESQASREHVHSDDTPFSAVKDVIQTFASSETSNLAFISKKSISIRNANSPKSCITMRTDDIEWVSGSMAGDYIIAVGKEKLSGQRSCRLYKVSTNGVLERPQLLRFVDLPSYFTHAVVSQEGRLIFQDRYCALLYLYCNDTRKLQLKVNSEEHPQLESPQDICFSGDGLWAFVRTSMQGNYHRIRVWYVADIRKSTYYDYQHELRDSTEPIKRLIPFPKSPFCILWTQYDKLWFLRESGPATNQPTIKKDNLQAMAISPDEMAIVFITGSKWKSELTISRLYLENGNFSFSDICSGIKLAKILKHPKKSAVAIKTSVEEITVIIAHSDGTDETKRFRSNGTLIA